MKHKCKCGVEKKGCVNDVNAMAKLILSKYEPDDELKRLICAAQPGDVIRIHTCGPGYHLPPNDHRLKEWGSCNDRR